MGEYRIRTKVEGVLKLIDVSGWQKWFGAAVLGFAAALASNYSFSTFQLQGLVVGVPLILCYIQSVNDCFDIEIDEVKEKLSGKPLVVSRAISRKTALAVTFSLLLIGLFSAWMGSQSLFLISCIMALFGTLYSVPPFRLKMVYPFSTLIQFAGCFLPFIAGFASVGAVTIQTVIISSVFAVIAMIHRLDHEIENYRVDLETGKDTVAVINGLKTAKKIRSLVTLVGVLEFAVFVVIGWLNIVIAFLFAAYLFVIIMPSMWLRRMPSRLKPILAHLVMVSSFFLFIVVLLLYWKI